MEFIVSSFPFHSFQGDADHMATEAQLAALQEQLVAVMLENQHLSKLS